MAWKIAEHQPTDINSIIGQRVRAEAVLSMPTTNPLTIEGILIYDINEKYLVECDDRRVFKVKEDTIKLLREINEEETEETEEEELTTFNNQEMVIIVGLFSTAVPPWQLGVFVSYLQQYHPSIDIFDFLFKLGIHLKPVAEQG